MEKFDVFISFKNTDANGERTQDSLMAENLYYALKKRNINAFYSNISIPESGEFEFGDMIDSAIEQCSIIVVVGTSIENFNAKWVSHEFKTFRQEMLSGNKPSERSAMFNYITKNINTNHLPIALRYCQAFTNLNEVVNAVCARFKKETEIKRNFAPVKANVDSLGVGTIVDGKYEILKEIGRGGMSVVYLATDIRLNKPWAIKILRKGGVRDFELVKQGLISEANMLKNLDHPNLPRIVDFIDTSDSFVTVMDYISGKPLSQILSEQGAQPEENVINWARQLCDVLRYLHSGTPAIIYRDMKPANVMLRPNGTVALIDFGTARVFKEKSVGDTTCLGTIGYAAPEQFGGMGQTDARTDIYCLGVTLYNLLTNLNPSEPPYEIKPIREINPKLSKGLEYIIKKATSRDPELRYQSVSDMLYDLDNMDKTERKARKSARLDKISGLFSENKRNREHNKPHPKTERPAFSAPQTPRTGFGPNNGFAVPSVPSASVPRIPQSVTKQKNSVPVYSVPNPYFNPVSVNNANSGDTTVLNGQGSIDDGLNAVCRYGIFVTSTPFLQKNSEVKIKFYLVTDDNRDRVKKALTQDREYSNFVASKVLPMRSNSGLTVELDSDVLFLSKHKVRLSPTAETETVRAVLSPSFEHNKSVGLNINVECESKIPQELSLEYSVR